jgi:hypothetical protein
MGRKIGSVVMIAFVAFGVAFFVYGVATGALVELMAFFQVYIGAFAGVYGVFAGTDAWQKNSRSKWYRPEMDDRHPEAQRAATEKIRREAQK